MPWVRNGTVSVTNGSASVTGASTTFQGSGVLPGHTFIGPDARLYEVLTVTSNTAMTVAPNYLGSTAAGQAYQIDTGPARAPASFCYGFRGRRRAMPPCWFSTTQIAGGGELE